MPVNTSEIISAMIFGDDGASKVEELSTDGGSTDAGKVLVVGDNGKIAASDLTVGEGEVAIDKGLVVNGAAADAKVVGDAIDSLNGSLGDVKADLGDAKSAIDQIDKVLDIGSETIIAPVEAYGINGNTGKNTSSSYWQYYRTAGFYKGTHVKATSTKGTLRSRIYFYAEEDVDTFISTSADYSQSAIDEDVVYPEGATCFRLSGFVNGNPDNPLDLSAVTLEVEIPNATNIIDTLTSDIEDIQNGMSETSEIVKKSIVSVVDTDIPYNLIPSDMEWTEGAQIDANNGGVISHATRLASDFIPIDASKQYLQIHIAVIHKEYNSETGDYIKKNIAPFVDYQYAFYDENKAFVASTSVSTDYVKVIPATAKYVRVTLAEVARKPFARLIYASSVNSNVVTVGMMEYKKIPTEKFQMPLTGYESFKMICFGDSITHGDTTGNNDGLSYVNYASQYLNANIESVGFGSTTAAKVSTSGTGLFCFPNLCDCIVSDDPTAWDALDAWAASGNTSFAEHLARLKAVDWSQVKAISILYGANDWAQNIPVGSDYNVTPGNYDGGIAYGITTLLTKYPHLQVMVLSPFYRSRTTGGETVISDDANGAGLTMMDYAASLKNVQKKLHVSVIDSGNWGISYLTMKVMSVDGTHPITDLGKQRIGHWFASAIKTHLSPI